MKTITTVVKDGEIVTSSPDVNKDNFAVAYNNEEHGQFMKLLKSFVDDTLWVPVKIQHTSYMPCDTVSADELAYGGAEALADTRNNSLPICVKLQDGKIICVREHLLKFLKQHGANEAAKLGPILTAGDYQCFCDSMNIGLKYVKKTIQALIRGGKISCWVSDYNHEWSMLQQVQFLEEKLFDAFPNTEFVSAVANTLGIYVNYKLDDSLFDTDTKVSIFGERTMEAYREAWTSAGLPIEDLEKATPMVRFTTGESGLVSIGLAPYLQFPDGTEFPLGPAVSVNHRGDEKAVWGKFETFPEQVAVIAQKGLDAIAELCDKVIEHPLQCMANCMTKFRASLPSRYMYDTLDCYEASYPIDSGITCSAILLFQELNQMLDDASEALSPERRLQNIEILARLIYENWDAFDTTALPKWYLAKKAADEGRSKAKRK